MTTRRRPGPTGHRYPKKEYGHSYADAHEWMENSACRDNPTPDVFFPDMRIGQREAVEKVVEAHCKICPVAAQCLKYRQTIQATVGIFGGQDFSRSSRLTRTAVTR